MKTIYPLLAMAALITGATSCQKVIDVKLNTSAQQYVIEGSIDDGPGPYAVSVSRTKNFTENNTFDKISGAQVIITDITSGRIDTLHESIMGTYQTATITGAAGHTYRLSVLVAGQAFTASSSIPAQAVSIDSMYTERSDFGGDDIYTTPVFTDPVGKGNYYRLRQWINGAEVKGSRVRSDDATDGATYRSPLFYDTDEDAGNPKIHIGDSISVELQCLNRQVYDYYRTLRSVTGENSATPANPLTNITGGALGIFNAHTSRKRSAIAAY